MTKESCNTNDFDILQALSAPMEDSEIEWKVQTVIQGQNGGYRALVVPYVQVRAIQNRLDRVCGLNWQSDYKLLTLGNVQGVECTISIYHNGQWIERSDAAELTNIEQLKGGYSDAMKRAAVQFGIGRFLYTLPKQWVDILPNCPQQPHEYVNSQYKVNGNRQFVRGYFIRPSVNAIMNRNTQPQQPPQQRGNQQKEQPQQPPQRGNQPPQPSQGNINNPTNEEMQKAIGSVMECLQVLNIPIEYLPELFKMVNAREYSHVEQASYEELQALYSMLGPVKMYMHIGRDSYKLSDDQLFAYASNLLREPIEKISNLFNKLDGQGVETIFNRIRNERKQKMA